MLSQTHITQAGKALFNAEKNGEQIGLLSLEHPEMNMDDAYLVQNAFIANKLRGGDKPIGWKIGLTSRAMQNALNIDIPDSGMLFESMRLKNGATIAPGRFIKPRIEAEIAFVVKADIGEASEEAILAATDYICPAIEILDTRIMRTDPHTGKMRTVFDTISDNAANAGVVFGEQKHDPRTIDLRWVGAILKRNDIVEETGLGAAVLDNPLTSMVWLVKRLAQYGQKIRKGEVVLSGSFIKVVEAPSGAKFQADFGDFGNVEVFFD